jgi:acyl-CoA synthetase (AMP-forming)/AMP-acid ligase II
MATFWSLITERAAASPDAEMLADEHGRSLSFAQYRDAAQRTAAGLHEWGVRPGSRVVWQLTTRIDTLVLSAALSRLGAVQVPVLPIYRGRELAFVLQQTRAEHVVVARRWRDIDLAGLGESAVTDRGGALLVVENAEDGLPEGDPATLPPPPPHDDEVRWIFYTSGTTSDPKGAMHTDRSAAAGGRVLVDGMEIGPSDRVAMVFPIAHIGGCAVWQAASLMSGATLVMTEYVDPATVGDLLRDQHITIAGTGPAHHAMYIADQRAHPGAPYFPAVRIYTSGGAAKPPSHYAMIKAELGKPVHSSYGLTEAPIVTCTHGDDPEEVLARSEGRAGAEVTLRIVDPATGAQVAPGASGEVRIKAPQVMRGYLDSSLDADAFDADGFLRTGDLGSLDEQGNLTITGRIKDVIIRKGETFSAREVEDLLITSPDVADVAVIGLPHPVLGEMACACVVAADPVRPPTLDSLAAHLAERGLMKQKWPERLELLDALPYNLAGKVIKADLRERFG